jgi:uncharacterized protein (DUF4213/DUF364 family)
MQLTLALSLSILGTIISVLSLIFNRKDKSNKDIKEEQKQFDKNNLIEYRLTKIEQNIEKILNKLDVYEKEIDDRIKIAIDNHIAIYHNKKGE